MANNKKKKEELNGSDKPIDNQDQQEQGPPENKSIADQQADHPSLRWYDEFEVRIQKRTVRNVLAGKDETIITGWEVVKKLVPKFIEDPLAKYLNSFANGYDVNNVGLFLVLKDTVKTGDVIEYKEWADLKGIDPKQDINQLLA